MGQNMRRYQEAVRGEVRFRLADEGLLAAAENEKGFIDSIPKRT
jgi:hypothetical protein